MDKHDRIQQLHRLFISYKRPLSISTIAEKLECSEKTVRRTIESLRDYSQAPLEYSEEHRGWHYIGGDLDKIQLPGLWLTAEEIHGFAHFLQVLNYLDMGGLSEEFKPIEDSIMRLLKSRKLSRVQFANKVCFLPKRRVASTGTVFKTISAALLNDKNLLISYEDYQGNKTSREVSPLKLVHYDENWYLDAWCSLRRELRSFMISRIVETKVTDTPARRVDIDDQEVHFKSSYGIFSGRSKHIACLKFSDASAREASSYQWHPDQDDWWEGTNYLLRIPYNDHRELLRVLLSYGPDVEVLEPTSLRELLLAKVCQTITNYGSKLNSGKF